MGNRLLAGDCPMIGDKLKKIIPPPAYLKMSAIGFDISDRSIKYVELAKKGDFFELARFGRTVLPEGLLQSGEIKNAPELKKFLNTKLSTEAAEIMLMWRSWHSPKNLSKVMWR